MDERQSICARHHGEFGLEWPSRTAHEELGDLHTLIGREPLICPIISVALILRRDKARLKF